MIRVDISIADSEFDQLVADLDANDIAIVNAHSSDVDKVLIRRGATDRTFATLVRSDGGTAELRDVTDTEFADLERAISLERRIRDRIDYLESYTDPDSEKQDRVNERISELRNLL